MKISFDKYFIRSWNESDINSLCKYANNKKIWLNLRDDFPYPYTRDDAINWIELINFEKPERNFAIVDQNEIIGAIGFIFQNDINRKSIELGYWLAEPFWRKGIMSEAVKQIITYAFEKYPINRIYAVVFADNTSSAKILQKNGFNEEGLLKASAVKDGIYKDQIIYAILQNQH